jgi:hypothetical protein
MFSATRHVACILFVDGEIPLERVRSESRTNKVEFPYSRAARVVVHCRSRGAVFLGNRKPVRRAVSEFWRVESIVPMVFKAALSILVHIRADIAWRLEALDRSDESALICLKGRLPTRRSTSLPISVSTQVHPSPFRSIQVHFQPQKYSRNPDFDEP